MSDLPNGWIETTIGEIIEFSPKNHVLDETEAGFVPMNLMGIRYHDKHGFQRRPWSEIKKGYTHFANGDVLLARITPCFENSKGGIVRDLPNGIGAGSTEYFVCRPIKNILLAKFLLAFFKTKEFLENGQYLMSGAVGQQRVPKDYVLNCRFPLAPLDEQTRIADKLDTLLTRVDSCQTHLARVQQLLKRFRQSVLAAATSGRLTEGWREDNSAIDDWKETDVQSVAIVGTGSTPLRSNPGFYSKKGTPWVTSSATGEPFITGAQEFVTDEAIQTHRLKLFPVGTLVIAMYGEGKTRGQVSELAIEATTNQACAAIIVDETKILKNYVKLALQANYLEMREMAEGGNQPNLNLSKIKEFRLPLPSIPEQHEIVRRVEALFALADRLEVRWRAAQGCVTSLTPSLLAKAFRGELVRQEAGDESAVGLLQRLRKTAEENKIIQRKPVDKKEHTKPEVNMLKRSEIKENHLSAILKERGTMTTEALWSASKLDIDEFYDQLKDEEAKNFLIETKVGIPSALSVLDAL